MGEKEVKELLLESICMISEDLITREVEKEIIIIPLTGTFSNNRDDLFTLNETGKAIWEKVDGKRSLADVLQLISEEFEGETSELEEDVLGFSRELYRRGMLVLVDN
jgi:hypothetical protein